jgi:Ca-activated chloride channel family protein
MIRALTPEELADLTTDDSDAGFGALATEKGCLPLRTLDVDVRIDGLSASTTVRQQFVNVFDGPLEATYIFPLPPRAAVTGFRLLADGVEIRGRIDERGQARRDYAQAISEGRQAAIVEEERPDVFTLRVGNIPARSVAWVEFTLVAPVTIDSLEATYRFPLVVAPRYCPGAMLDGDPVGDGIAFDTDLVPDASRISPPILLPGLESPVRLGIAVHVAAGTATAASPEAFGCSLPADDSLDDAGCRTITVVPDQRLDRDFILRWKVGDEAATVTAARVEPDAARPAGLGTGAAVADAPGDGTFTLSIVPPAAAVVAAQPRDVVFLLDRSGSMRGWQIAAARRAVARVIDSLSADDRVAAIAFDDVVEHGASSATLMPATDRNRWRLLEWLATVEARGGTVLAPAIEAVLAVEGSTAPMTPAEAARSRCIVLVTDAQVGDEDHVLRTLAKNLGDARLFVVGIDNAVNEGLISRLADASGGLVELVESEDRLDDVLERIRARIQPPLVRDLRLAGDGIELIPDSIVPSRMPDLVAGLPLVLRGRYRSKAPGATVRVEGMHVAGAAWETTATVADGATPGIGSLWARGMLRQLEDRWVTTDAAGGGLADEAAEAVADTEQLESRIVRLSTSFGVLCRFTALVAIDERRPDQRPQVIEPRRVVQTVHMLSPLLARRSPFVLSRARDPSDLCLSGPPTIAPPMVAMRLLRRVRPRSGRLADVSAARIADLRSRVRRLAQLIRDGGELIALAEQLETAADRLEATGDGHAHLAMLLEALADVVEAGGCVADRWWLGNASPRRP